MHPKYSAGPVVAGEAEACGESRSVRSGAPARPGEPLGRPPCHLRSGYAGLCRARYGSPRKLAAVRREVAPGEVGAAWGPAVGKVWDFIRSQSGLWTGGHNVFVYHHPKEPGGPLLCDFGVEVTRIFDTSGELYASETPGGEAAVAVHRGAYDRMNEAYDAIDKWMVANQRGSAGLSWEVYGDPTPGPVDTETTLVHLLK
jgi:effector-binding domain-containing protein